MMSLQNSVWNTHEILIACVLFLGWMTDNSFIYSGRGHADDSYLVLTLKLGGFRGNEQLMNGKPVPVATISFYFELVCSARCTFFFMQVRVLNYLTYC